MASLWSWRSRRAWAMLARPARRTVLIALVMAQVGWPSQVRGQAHDPVHDLFGGPRPVQAAGVTAEPECLPGSGNRRHQPGRCG